MAWSHAAKSHARARRATAIGIAKRAEKARLNALYKAEQTRLRNEAEHRRIRKDLRENAPIP